MKTLAAALIAIVTAPAANAQPVQGLYVAGGTGIAMPSARTLGADSTAAAPQSTSPSAAATANAQINNSLGPAQSASAGWGFGNGLRVEVQGLHAAQSVSTTP